LIRASSALAVASTLVAEAAIPLNLAGSMVVDAIGEDYAPGAGAPSA
jgi:hypothetical protein